MQSKEKFFLFYIIFYFFVIVTLHMLFLIAEATFHCFVFYYVQIKDFFFVKNKVTNHLQQYQTNHQIARI